jgi:hypothetical protein
MDLRWFSFDWYATLGLPNEETTTYVLKYRYGDWTHENRRKICIKFDITGTEYTRNHYSVLSWVTCLDLAPSMTLCDSAFITRYPQIMGNQEERAPA